MTMPTDPSLLSLDGSLGLLLPIAALMPLVAVLMVSQSNPYQTLPLRGVFGSVAMLLYGLLGAPDVALTEAMVGTLLSTTLYVIALRSSMTLRIEDRRTRSLPEGDPTPTANRSAAGSNRCICACGWCGMVARPMAGWRTDGDW